MTYDRAVVKGDAKIIAAIINGIKAADAPGYAGNYAAVPLSEAARAAVKPGKNVLAVHCHQTVGGQGIDVGIAAAEEAVETDVLQSASCHRSFNE